MFNRKANKIKINLFMLTILLFVVGGISLANAATYSTNNSYIRVSSNQDRTKDVELTNKTLKGLVYIFVKPTSVKNVYFYLDSPLQNNQLNHSNYTSVQYNAPFDLMGTVSETKASPLNTKYLSKGVHTLRTIITWSDGYESLKVVTFYVSSSISTANTTTSIGTTTSTTPTTTTPPPTTTIATTTTSTTIPVTSPLSKTGYSLAWGDEFNGSTLDTSKWQNGGNVDYDLSCMTMDNVKVANGLLDIKQNSGASCSKTIRSGNIAPTSTSGYIRNSGLTNRLVSPTQSAAGILRIEIRAQMPYWQVGTWPGLWTRNKNEGGYGEIDLIEQWGTESSSNVVISTSHFSSVTNQKANSLLTASPLDKTFHTYATEININNGGSVSYFIDDQLIARHTSASFNNVSESNFLIMLKGYWDSRLMIQTTGPLQTYTKWGDPAKGFGPQVEAHLYVDSVAYFLKN